MTLQINSDISLRNFIKRFHLKFNLEFVETN